MKKKKRTFFERITGSVKMDEFNDEFEYENEEYDSSPELKRGNEINFPNYDENPDGPEESGVVEIGELSVDVINQPDELVIRAIVAGIKPHDLDVQISRDMVTIAGSREDLGEIEEEDYYHRELYWGSFSRNIILPEEIDVEESSAEENHGMLEIHLPKIDKNKKTKLQVKSA